MHIEPGLVSEAKMALSYATAAAAATYTLKLSWEALRTSGPISLALRSVLCSALVFAFFEILPHRPVGVSEVHLILGSTLFLMFGAAPAAIGLAMGLLVQSMFFQPADLPQYGMNVTTLLVPLFAIQALAAQIIKPNTRYVDLRYGQALALSTIYQGGVVTWVAFWAIYGQGFAVSNLSQVALFGGAYMLVVLVEPLVDLAILAVAKKLHGLRESGLFEPRLFSASA